MGGERCGNPALRVSPGCAGTGTRIDKGTKCDSKSPPGQKGRFQLWLLLFGYVIYDGDGDDMGALLEGDTQFAKVYVTPLCTPKTHLACTALETQVQVVLSL